VRGGLLAHLQHEMAHVFVGFTELFVSMCINPGLQLCSWVEVSQEWSNWEWSWGRVARCCWTCYLEGEAP